VEPKTKMLVAVLHAIAPRVSKTKTFNVLLVPADQEKGMFRAAANLPKVKIMYPSALNVHDILNYKQILIDKEAVSSLSKHFTRS